MLENSIRFIGNNFDIAHSILSFSVLGFIQNSRGVISKGYIPSHSG